MYGGLCSSAWPISVHPGTWQGSAHVGQLAATSAVAARDPLAHHHPVRSPRPRRAAYPAFLLLSALGALAGCSSEASLTLPDLDTADSWVVVLSGGDMTVPYAQVLGADEALRLGAPRDSDVRLEVLAFDDVLDAPIGPLDPQNTGAALPKALATYAAVLDDGPPHWRSQEPSTSASQLRLPHAEPTCPRLEGTSEVVTDDDREGIVGLVGLGRDRLAVFTDPVWWLLDELGVHAVPTQVHGVRAAAIDFLSAVWLATPTDIWTIYGEDPKVVTASLAWSLPPGLLTVALAAPKPARLFLLSHDGALYLSTREGTREIYRFEGAEPGTIAQLVVDSHGVLATFGGAKTFVRVTEEGEVTELQLPPGTSGESATAIARLGELGIVVGTNAGRLRAERLGFEALPDPRGALPKGVPIRVVREVNGELYFGGASGLFGVMTAERLICVSSTPATSAVRYIATQGGDVLAGGHPLANALTLVQLSRFRR